MHSKNSFGFKGDVTMFCKYCGNAIDSDSVFCKVCGKNITAESQAQEPVINNPVEQEHVEVQTYVEEVVMVNPEPIPQATYDPAPIPQIEYKSLTETPSKKRKGNNKVLPIIMLPIAVIISTLVSSGISTLWSMLLAYIYDYANIYSSENPFIFTYIFSFLGGIIGILPPLIIMVLFSLCCKGINKKIRFIGSYYAAGVAGIVANVVNAIIVCIINSTIGFYDIESMTIYSLISSACSLLLNIIVSPVIALLWFAASEKYIVKKEIKARPVKLILPGVFLGIYGLFCLAMYFINQSIYTLFYELFGEYKMFGDYGLSVSSTFSRVITTGACLICLFLLALACKGGYRKLAFVGSFYFASGITGAVSSLVSLPFSIGGSITTQALGNVIGTCVQYLLIIGLSILIYILLNRYEVEKIKKKAD